MSFNVAWITPKPASAPQTAIHTKHTQTSIVYILIAAVYVANRAKKLRTRIIRTYFYLPAKQLNILYK